MAWLRHAGREGGALDKPPASNILVFALNWGRAVLTRVYSIHIDSLFPLSVLWLEKYNFWFRRKAA